jgi:hypothetical protein
VLAKEMIHKIMNSCQRDLDELEQGDKRKAVGSLDYAKDRTVAAISILINEIIDKEGKF